LCVEIRQIHFLVVDEFFAFHCCCFTWNCGYFLCCCCCCGCCCYDCFFVSCLLFELAVSIVQMGVINRLNCCSLLCVDNVDVTLEFSMFILVLVFLILQSWNSPCLKLCYLCLWQALKEFKTLLEEKSNLVNLSTDVLK
jgi:hypothetical protein